MATGSKAYTVHLCREIAYLRGDILHRREALQQVLMAHRAPDAIRTKYETVALPIGHLHHICHMVGGIPQSTGNHIRLRRHACLFLRQHLATHQIAHQRVIVRAIPHPPATQLIAAAVAQMSDEGRLSADQYSHQRRTHASQFGHQVHLLFHGIIGTAHSHPQRGGRRCLGIALHQRGKKLVLGNIGCRLSARTATHAIAYHQGKAEGSLRKTEIILVFRTTTLHGVGKAIQLICG